MDILITGGTGFIGRELCRHLLEEAHSLTVLSRQPEQDVKKICGEPVTAIHDLTKLTPEDRFDGIINLAGESLAGGRWTEKRKQTLWDSRVTLTEQLIDFIAKAKQKPAVLVSGSAVGYYGDQGERILDEEAAPQNGFGHRLCAGWEETAWRASDHGVRVCIIRTGLVIGKHGGLLQRMVLPFKLGLGGRLGNGRQWMSWVHRQDHIRMMLTLLHTPHLYGVFNGTAPHPVTNEEFTQTLAKVLKRPALFAVPAWVLKPALGEMAGLLLGGQRVLPKRFQGENFPFQFETLEPALRDALAS